MIPIIRKTPTSRKMIESGACNGEIADLGAMGHRQGGIYYTEEQRNTHRKALSYMNMALPELSGTITDPLWSVEIQSREFRQALIYPDIIVRVKKKHYFSCWINV